MKPGYATFVPMSMTGTSAPATERTWPRSPSAFTTPSSMKTASAIGGSSIVTIRPTMTRLRLPEAATVPDGADDDEGALPGAFDGESDAGDVGPQAMARTATRSEARGQPGYRGPRVGTG